MTMSNNHELALGLRELADYVESHEVSLGDLGYGLRFEIEGFGLDKAELRSVLTGGTGTWKKTFTGAFLEIRRSFGQIDLVFNADREQVCTKTVTGQRTVPASPERVEDIVEWECHSILAP